MPLQETFLDRFGSFKDPLSDKDYPDLTKDVEPDILGSKEILTLQERIRNRQEIIVPVVIGIPGGPRYYNSLALRESLVLLGKRAENGNWGPVVGHIEPNDIKTAFKRVSEPLRSATVHNVWEAAASRNLQKEIRGLDWKNIDRIFCHGFHDNLEGKDVHILAIEAGVNPKNPPKIFPVSKGFIEFRWFDPRNLPSDIDSFSLKAVINAARGLTEVTEYSDDQSDVYSQYDEVRERIYFPIFGNYLIWLRKSIESLPYGHPTRELLISEEKSATGFLRDEYMRSSFRDFYRKQIESLKEEEIEIPGDIKDWSTERLKECLKGWQELRDWSKWFPRRSPFLVILSRPYPDLPKTIVFGEQPWAKLESRFDQIWLPNENKISETLRRAAELEITSFLVETQAKALRQMDANSIPQGATFPIELIAKYDLSHNGITLISDTIIDAGCGMGKSKRLLDQGFNAIGIDINTEAVAGANAKGLRSFEHDVTKIGFTEHPAGAIIGVEGYGAFLAEGLFCNLIGTQPEKFLKVVDYYLAPGGKIFVADMLQPQEEEEYLKNVAHLGETEYQKLVYLWNRRYSINEKIGLPRGTFVVVRPGEYKKFEWGDEETVAKLKASSHFERFARHYTKEEIKSLFFKIGYEQKEFIPTVFYSRTNDPLLGFFLVYQKPEKYRYHPFFYGQEISKISIDQLPPEGYPGSVDYLRRSVEKIKEHLSDWETIFPGLKEFLK